MRDREADTLLRFVRVGRPAATAAVALTEEPGSDRRAQADRLVRHWRNELVPLAALPGVGGRFAQPIREVLAGTVQGMLVLSLARLAGVTDEREQVRLVASLVLRERLPAAWAPAAKAGPARVTVPAGDAAVPTAGDAVPAVDGPALPADSPALPADGPAPLADSPAPLADGPVTPVDGPVTAADDGATKPIPAGVTPAPREAAEDAEDAAAEETVAWRLVAQRVPVTIYRAARELWTIHQLAGQRAEGRLWHRALGNLPAVGIVGAALGERHALADLAAAAYAELGLAPVELAPPSTAARAVNTARDVAGRLPALGRDLKQRSPFRKP
ncbi:hypothetical protein I6A84_41655 [Frankia sp. CNm7]|uniref:Uncharacterized protein n=1 Tax=Frankia nepalensis TaxID=1836974 RepID=A0A937RH30_9ACTN|nr:hypothetical protein [Frankia nepalensis]MBL7513864.1 hypothetical protein [Frankia nepalensis]MBL7524374.1 hypothetical protein [Frankia nepalensis]MBL7625916.1 hypothetical protein [Frankia nepalensis]